MKTNTLISHAHATPAALSLWHRIYLFRFEILLASLIIVFLLNIFFPFNVYGGFAQGLYLPFQLMAGIILFEKKGGIRWGLCVLAVGILLCHWLDFFLVIAIKKQLMLLYILFFSNITLELFRQMSHIRAVTMQSVVAAICGLLLIGYCGFYIFLAIELHSPGSFQNIGSDVHIVNNLFYFSYITILTIGYGDIVPHTWVARNAVVFLAVISYIYSVVVVAAIVGRLRRNPSLQATQKSSGAPTAHPLSTQKCEMTTELLFIVERMRYGHRYEQNDHPDTLEAVGRIEVMCHEAQAAGLSVHYSADDIPTLAHERSRVLCNVAYEAVENTKKHAHARHLFVNISLQKDFIVLTMEDDGIGFETSHKTQATASGLGLQLMNIYAHTTHGECNIVSSRGHGTHITFKLPPW